MNSRERCQDIVMEAFAMSVQGFCEQRRWGTRTFDGGMQMDGESEEDGMEGELCARGEHCSWSITMG